MSTQEIVHAEPILGSLNLAGVSGADRVDGVGPDNARFEIAHVTPEFQATGIVEARIQAKIRKRRGWKISLVAEIVDGQQGAHAIEGGVTGKGGSQIRSDESRLPIVRVDHVRTEDVARDP